MVKFIKWPIDDFQTCCRKLSSRIWETMKIVLCNLQTSCSVGGKESNNSVHKKNPLRRCSGHKNLNLCGQVLRWYVRLRPMHNSKTPFFCPWTQLFYFCATQVDGSSFTSSFSEIESDKGQKDMSTYVNKVTDFKYEVRFDEVVVTSHIFNSNMYMDMYVIEVTDFKPEVRFNLQ